jgi:hypothetical protein
MEAQVKWKRRAFVRFVAQPLRSTMRFIAAFRFNARIISVHQAALAPNRPDEICPPASEHEQAKRRVFGVF